MYKFIQLTSTKNKNWSLLNFNRVFCCRKVYTEKTNLDGKKFPRVVGTLYNEILFKVWEQRWFTALGKKNSELWSLDFEVRWTAGGLWQITFPGQEIVLYLLFWDFFRSLNDNKMIRNNFYDIWTLKK